MRIHNPDKGRNSKSSHSYPSRARDPQSRGSGQAYPRVPPVDVKKAIMRKDALARYRKDMGLSDDEMAIRLMLPLERVRELLDGASPITNELATHIEEMLALPASWLDNSVRDSFISAVQQPADSTPPRASNAPAPTGAENMNSTADTQDIPAATRNMPAAQKKQIVEIRRQNLIMLTSQRGTKHRLGHLAGTSGSRISLMTSGRKPVSDPFAVAIEDSLTLPRRWLDTPRQTDDVPSAVWDLLSVDPENVERAESLQAPNRAQQAKAAPARAASPSRQIAPDREDVLVIVERKPASALPSTAPAARSEPVAIASAPAGSSIFDKEPGKAGAIAEALAKTVLRLSVADRLTEARAFQLLGMLIDEDARS